MDTSFLLWNLFAVITKPIKTMLIGEYSHKYRKYECDRIRSSHTDVYFQPHIQTPRFLTITLCASPCRCEITSCALFTLCAFDMAISMSGSSRYCDSHRPSSVSIGCSRLTSPERRLPLADGRLLFVHYGGIQIR